MVCTYHQIFSAWPDQEARDGWGMCHVWARGEMHSGFRLGELKDRDHLVDLVIDWKIMLQWILNCGLDWRGSEVGQVVAVVTAVMKLGFQKVQEVSCLKNCTYDVAHPLLSPWPDLITLITWRWAAVQIMKLLMQFLQSPESEQYKLWSFSCSFSSPLKVSSTNYEASHVVSPVPWRWAAQIMKFLM